MLIGYDWLIDYLDYKFTFSFISLKYSQLAVRLAAPHQLNPKPEADDLVFGKHFTDHMLKIAYHRRLGGWQTPEIMPLENLVLHPAAKVFHYAVEVSFEPLSTSLLVLHYSLTLSAYYCVLACLYAIHCIQLADTVSSASDVIGRHTIARSYQSSRVVSSGGINKFVFFLPPQVDCAY